MNKNGNKYSQDAAMSALSHEEIEKHSGKVKEMKSLKDKYNQEGINCPPEKDDQKKFEKNNRMIALNVLYVRK